VTGGSERETCRVLVALQNVILHDAALALLVRDLHALAEGGEPRCLPSTQAQR
jgi:hypothetical protein